MNQADIFSAGAQCLQMTYSTEMTTRSLIIERTPIYAPVNLNPRIEAIVCIIDYPCCVVQQFGKIFAEGFARRWIAKRSSMLRVIKGDEGRLNFTAGLCQLKRTVTTKWSQRHKLFNAPNIDFHEVLFCSKNHIGRLVRLRTRIQGRNCVFYQHVGSDQAKNHSTGAEMRSSLLSQYVASRFSCCKIDSADERADGANRPDPICPFGHPHFYPRNGAENEVCEIQKDSNDTCDRYCAPLSGQAFVGVNDWGKVNNFFTRCIHRSLSVNNWRNRNTSSIGGGK